MGRVKEDEGAAECMIGGGGEGDEEEEEEGGGEGERGHGRGARVSGNQRQLCPETGTGSVLVRLSSLHVSRR